MQELHLGKKLDQPERFVLFVDFSELHFCYLHVSFYSQGVVKNRSPTFISKLPEWRKRPGMGRSLSFCLLIFSCSYVLNCDIVSVANFYKISISYLPFPSCYSRGQYHRRSNSFSTYRSSASSHNSNYHAVSSIYGSKRQLGSPNHKGSHSTQ